MPPIPEKLRSGNAFVSCAILASESGSIAGPPSPPLDTSPSTLISNSSVSGSMTGIDGKVLDETMASAPTRKHAPASTTMSAVAGVSLHHTGTLATSFTASVTTEQRPWSLPMLEPISRRSMCGQEKLSSRPSAPSPCAVSASSCQCRSSLSFPEPAMIDAISTLPGKASLMRRMRGAHHSRVLSDISSQFHEECKAAPGLFFMDTFASSGLVRMNFALAPYTFTTGCSPMVLVTTPPHPASKARMMFDSDSVGGAEERRKGFSNWIPVNVTERSTAIQPPNCCAARGAFHRAANQDIQLVPASLFHFVVIFFDCVQNSIEPRPVMSPTPNLESFQPPNEKGSRGTGTPTLTPTIPALACSIT